MTGRLHNLDYLRGLAASGIMMYHYLTWTFGRYQSEDFMGRVGVYGVSIFYVLSGLTLFYVYYDKMQINLQHLKDFFIKRVFRIFPLLWLTTFGSIYFLVGEMPETQKLILNLTGLFGFVAWDQGIGIGVWSIGNELVFYVFFPVFVLLGKKSKVSMLLMSLILLAIYIYFAFFLIDADRSIGADGQQRNYINPLNQVFLFLSGFLIGYLFRKINVASAVNLIILVAGILLFVLYPANGDTVHLITRGGRIAFTLSCLMICFSFYKLKFELPNIIHRPLKLLGEASYSVYLLHPIMHFVAGILIAFLSKHVIPLPESVRFVVAIVLTLATSYFVYRYFEKYFVKLGKRFSTHNRH